MDLTSDFPNAQIYEAQAIIQKFNKMIDEINQKKETIRKIHENLDTETQKIDLILKDVHNIKVFLKNTDLTCLRSLNQVEKNINNFHKNAMHSLEKKIDDISESNTGRNILMASFASLSIGFLLGLYFMRK